MIYPQTIAETLLGLMGGEPGSTLEEKESFEAANKLIDEWNNSDATWLAEMCEHLSGVSRIRLHCSGGQEKKCYALQSEERSEYTKLRQQLSDFRGSEMCEACRVRWHLAVAALLCRSISITDDL